MSIEADDSYEELVGSIDDRGGKGPIDRSDLDGELTDEDSEPDMQEREPARKHPGSGPVQAAPGTGQPRWLIAALILAIVAILGLAGTVAWWKFMQNGVADDPMGMDDPVSGAAPLTAADGILPPPPSTAKGFKSSVQPVSRPAPGLAAVQADPVPEAVPPMTAIGANDHAASPAEAPAENGALLQRILAMEATLGELRQRVAQLSGALSQAGKPAGDARIASLEERIDGLEKRVKSVATAAANRPVFPGWSVAALTRDKVLLTDGGRQRLVGVGETFAGIRIKSIDLAGNRVKTSAGIIKIRN